ncbi:putative cytosolic iron-sulfur protein assembly protein 1 [Podosphaera aphanis]|nr:putative cytosolic iron-sulfur protein assembly protein 1 [Podosphaera aphanis]
MASENVCHLVLFADFRPSASARSWISIPNPNSLPLIATATSDKTARIYSLTDFTLHSTLQGGHSRSVRSVEWKPNAKRTDFPTLVTGSFDATLGIWRHRPLNLPEKEGQRQNNPDQNQHKVDLLDKFSAQLDLSSSDNTSTSEEKKEDWEFAVVLEGHDSEIKHVAYSQSGQYLASCSRDKSIWIWEEVGAEGDDEFETVAVLQDHTADVKCIAWRKDDGLGELLASGSYDETIRFWRDVDGEGEWECTGVLEGHTGTVWALEWEPEVSIAQLHPELQGQEEKGTPRLMSASADCTIRLWSKAISSPPSHPPSYSRGGIPSTMRPAPAMETWEVSAILPRVHTFPIYSISWSKMSGRVLSAGGDGKIAVYAEKTIGRSTVGASIETQWYIIGILGSSHGPYEVNHITWCGRWDNGRQGEEEMVVTTGDDGSVKAWKIEDQGA